MWSLAVILCVGMCWVSWWRRLSLVHRGTRVLSACAVTGLAWALPHTPLTVRWLVVGGCCLVVAELARAWAWPADFEGWAIGSGLARGTVGLAGIQQGWSPLWVVVGAIVGTAWWFLIARRIQSAASTQGGSREVISMVIIHAGTVLAVVGGVATGHWPWWAAVGLLALGDTVDGRDRFVKGSWWAELGGLAMLHVAFVSAAWA